MDITPGSESLSQVQSHPHASTDKLLERFHFPKFKHEHTPPIVNVNEVVQDKLTVGQKVADAVANGMGSWTFIIIQASFLVLWIIVNSVIVFLRFDGPPFILLNLILSFQAGFAAPVIMMSQNRQAQKDRITAQNDYNTDCKGEGEIRHIMEHLDHQDDLILKIVERLEQQHQAMMARLTELDPEMAQKLGAEMQQGMLKQE